MRKSILPRLAWRSTACLASGTALFVAMAAPAAAIDIDTQTKGVFCFAGAPHLVLDVSISPSGTRFGASATAHLCNATAIRTAVTLQAVGAGASASPTVAGGPILFAPFVVATGNVATVDGHSSAPSSLVQSVILNVTGVAVGATFVPVQSCQIVYDRMRGSEFKIDGCNARVTILG